MYVCVCRVCNVCVCVMCACVSDIISAANHKHTILRVCYVTCLRLAAWNGGSTRARNGRSLGVRVG